MKKLVVLISFLAGMIMSINAQSGNSIKVYTNFLQQQNTSAKDYVFKLFEKYDIVILCERDHREMTQYDLLLDIFRDPRFAYNVRNAYFEIGNNTYNERLNDFLQDASLSPEEVKAKATGFQRNAYGPALWEKSNYAYYLEGVHAINRNLPEGRKVNIHGLDVGVDWESCTREDIQEKNELVSVRDSIMGTNFIRAYKNQNTKKALVVLNYRHAFTTDLVRTNTGRFIADAFKKKVANVYINSAAPVIGEDGDVYMKSIQDGKWDAAFFKTKKFNVGFDFYKSPFGKDKLDMIPVPNDLTYQDVFTGFIYYTFTPNLVVKSGLENFIDDAFAPELIRRYQLEEAIYGNQVPDINELKKNLNTVSEVTYHEEMPGLTKDIEKWLE